MTFRLWLSKSPLNFNTYESAQHKTIQGHLLCWCPQHLLNTCHFCLLAQCPRHRESPVTRLRDLRLNACTSCPDSSAAVLSRVASLPPFQLAVCVLTSLSVRDWWENWGCQKEVWLWETGPGYSPKCALRCGIQCHFNTALIFELNVFKISTFSVNMELSWKPFF